MPWEKVTDFESTSIESISFDSETGRLRIQMVHGELLEYHHVPESVWKSFKRADSKGLFYNQNIRTSYSFVNL